MEEYSPMNQPCPQGSSSSPSTFLYIFPKKKNFFLFFKDKHLAFLSEWCIGIKVEPFLAKKIILALTFWS